MGNLYFPPESLGVMGEFWYIEFGLLLVPWCDGSYSLASLSWLRKLFKYMGNFNCKHAWERFITLDRCDVCSLRNVEHWGFYITLALRVFCLWFYQLRMLSRSICFGFFIENPHIFPSSSGSENSIISTETWQKYCAWVYWHAVEKQVSLKKL